MRRNKHNTTTTAQQQTRDRDRVFSSSSSSSSSSRSYSPPSSSILPQTPRISTLDQVWRDISFSPAPPPPVSLPHHQNPNPNPSSNPSSFRGVILQDFLAGPFKDIHSSSARNHIVGDFPLPLPPTALSLNSTQLSCSAALPRVDINNNNIAPPFVVPRGFSHAVIASPPTVGLFSFCPNERSSALESPFGLGGGDRRHKRMMKNRESAARSRARRQAYTNELELEVAHLVAENEKLKKQYEELRLAMAAQHSTKKSLQRTLTAPF